MDDNKVKWTRKVRRYLRDAFSWLDTGLMLNALLIMDITFAGCFGMMQWRYNKEIGELEDMLYMISSFMARPQRMSKADGGCAAISERAPAL